MNFLQTTKPDRWTLISKLNKPFNLVQGTKVKNMHSEGFWLMDILNVHNITLCLRQNRLKGGVNWVVQN